MSLRLARNFACCLAAILFMVPTLLCAQSSDYSLTNSDWNGLSQLTELARAENIELKLVSNIDFQKLPLEQPILIIHPQQPVVISNLINFVFAGGRILLADDFGTSDALFDRLAVSRAQIAPANLPHYEFVDNNPAFPIFKPTGRHPLLNNVETLVANRPAVLFNVGSPVVSFADHGGLVYDMSLGDGKVILLSDPSMLINNMLLVADNSAFAKNALRYLCADVSPCTILVVLETWTESGSFTALNNTSEHKSELQKHIDNINQAISNLSKDLPLTQLLYYLSILLTLGLIAYLATVFSLRRPAAYSKFIARTLDSSPTSPGELEWNIARFTNPHKTFFVKRAVNYALPMAILKEIFEDLFFTHLGLSPISPQNHQSSAQLAIRFGARVLNAYPEDERDKLENELVELLDTFASIPARHRVFFDSEAYFSERDLLNTYRKAQKILNIMGLKDEYERRTSTSA